MDHNELLTSLQTHYKKMEPHHDTWVLWTKDNKTAEEFYEVAIGTILVQNTNWVNVDKAVDNLRSNHVFSFDSLFNCENDKLIELIKPAGFFSQKSVYLKAMSKVFLDLQESEITREVLLKTNGIGKETADSLLNFCLRRPVPVVGTYTKRFFAKLFGDSKYLSKKYEFIQDEVLKSFIDPTAHELGLYHALIVSHSQNTCKKRNPECSSCYLKKKCAYFISTIEKTEFHELINKKINPIKKNG